MAVGFTGRDFAQQLVLERLNKVPVEWFTNLASLTNTTEEEVKWVIILGAEEGKTPDEFFEYVAMKNGLMTKD